MSKRCKLYILSIVVIICMFNFNGCASIENKFVGKNGYFENLNSSNIEQISIQSTRDTGFKFIVTEESAIKEICNFLYKAKDSEVKSNLEPDYRFIFDLGDEVKEFYYIVGSDEGNFYNDTNIFTVSKRLDEDIIKNLSFIRKPRDFEYIYYNSILEVLQKSVDNSDIKNLKIGVNIKGDIDCLKYVFSNDLKTFLEKAKQIAPNVALVDNNESDFDVVFTVKNRGYNTTNFKTLITLSNKSQNTEEKYYVVAVNEYKEWNIEVTGPNPESKPSNW